MDNSIAAVKSGNFTSYSDTNGVFHYVYSVNNTTIFDLWNSLTYIPLNGLTLDGTGTNVALTIVQTNLANGYSIQSSTNLALGSAGFLPFTNYSISTNTGIVTFTIPVNFSEPMRFWRAIAGSAYGSAFFKPVSFSAGTLYPSNTWSLATITNGMKSGDIITVNSNGLKLVDVWLSNSVPILKPHW